MPDQSTTRPLFHPRSPLTWMLLALIFAAGLGIRLYDLADPPLDFHPTRQLHSALIARGMYYESEPGVPQNRRDLAVTFWETEGQIEPQVFERLVAWSYEWSGGENLQIPRLYAIVFWMGAAAFVTLLSVELIGWGGALAGVLFFLAWPYGVIASRAFQPEPLMMLFLSAGLWAAVRWERQRAWRWAAASGLLCGMAIYIKAVAVFFIAPALLILVLSHGPRRALRSAQVWMIVFLAVLPYGLYLLDGVFLRGYLVSQFSQRFFPEMWVDLAFYLRWISNLGRVLPFELLVISIVGVLLVRHAQRRWMLLAVWAGYLLYGLALPHHISTHDYYHLPLLLPVALGLAALGETIFNHLRVPHRLARASVGIALVAVLAFNIYTARTTLKRFDAAGQAQSLADIGQALGPGASVVALVDDYGAGLKYYAWINPTLWPAADDIRWMASQGEILDFAVFFDEQVQGRDYFVASPDELARQPGLEERLVHFPLLDGPDGWRIYNLREAQP